MRSDISKAAARHLAVAGEQERAERSARQSAAATLGWSTRRRHAADRFGTVALKALDRLEAELDKSRPRGIQGLGMTASMLAKQAEEMLAAVGSTGSDMTSEARMVRERDMAADLFGMPPGHHEQAAEPAWYSAPDAPCEQTVSIRPTSAPH